MPRLVVSWKASGGRARGFYHPDEERLVVCLQEARPFASFIDAEHVQVDLDADGHFIGLAVDATRESWPVAADLFSPKIGIPATVRFCDTPATLDRADLTTDPDRIWLRIGTSLGECEQVIEPCEGMLFEVSSTNHLLCMWVLNIHEDYGSRQLRAWREQVR
jgi:hypothetical protein